VLVLVLVTVVGRFSRVPASASIASLSCQGKGATMVNAGRRWPRRVVVSAGAAVGVLVVAAVTLKYWIAPGIVRRQVAAAVGDYWAGRVEVGWAEFRFFSPPVVGDVVLGDADGRQWVRIGRIEPDIPNWPSLSPTIAGLLARGVTVTAYVVEGGVSPPVRTGRGNGGRRGTPPSVVRLDELACTLVDVADGASLGCEGLALSIRRQGTGSAAVYRLLLERPASTAPAIADGTIDADSGEMRLAVNVRGHLSPRDVAVIGSAASAGPLPELSGLVAAELEINGRLEQWRSLHVRGRVDANGVHVRTGGGTAIRDLSASLRVEGQPSQPATLRFHGPAAVGGLTVRSGGAPVIDDLSGEVRLDGQRGAASAALRTPVGALRFADAPVTFDPNAMRLTVRLADANADIAAGEHVGDFWRRALAGTTARGRAAVSGPLSLGLGPPWPVDCDLRVAPRLEELVVAGAARQRMGDLEARVRVRPGWITVSGLKALYGGGKLEAEAAVWLLDAPSSPLPQWRRWGHANLIEGIARGTLDNVDVHVMPLVPELMLSVTKIVLRPGAPASQGVSDLSAAVNLSRGVVTIRRARVANPISALEIEPGGTINLLTRELNFYVFGVSLNVLRDVLLDIPVANLLVNLKDKLVRLHVEGPWTAPTDKLIRKEPVGDVAAGTMDFFRGVAKAGGQLTSDVLKGIGELFALPAGPLRDGGG